MLGSFFLWVLQGTKYSRDNRDFDVYLTRPAVLAFSTECKTTIMEFESCGEMEFECRWSASWRVACINESE